jgi:hypothetical protein
MAKASRPHPAHAHIQRAKAAAQAHHDQIMQHLSNIEQALPQDQQQQPGVKPGAPTGPSTGVTMPGGMSPLGGQAGG